MKVNGGLFITFALLTTLLLGMSSAAEAGRTDSQLNSFSATGTVIAVDAADQTITVRLGTGSRLVRDKVGEDLTFRVAKDTFIGCGIGWAACPLLHPGSMRQTNPGGLPGDRRGGKPLREVKLSDIDINDEVQFRGTISDEPGNYTINQLMVWVSGEETSRSATL
ncbi:MAG: hypothetical protein AAGU11_23120 [Syntrophobacteraceae bacterium]